MKGDKLISFPRTTRVLEKMCRHDNQDLRSVHVVILTTSSDQIIRLRHRCEPLNPFVKWFLMIPHFFRTEKLSSLLFEKFVIRITQMKLLNSWSRAQYDQQGQDVLSNVIFCYLWRTRCSCDQWQRQTNQTQVAIQAPYSVHFVISTLPTQSVSCHRQSTTTLLQT